MPPLKTGGTPALPLRVRHATVADIPTLMVLEKQAPTAAHWSSEQYQTVFSGEAPPRVALIIEDETGVQGFIIGKALHDEWEIENLTVARSARTRGLGTCLVERFLDLARAAAHSVFLEVRESNQAARRLYEKCAFVAVGRRQRYYVGPSEDAIVYRLQFH